MPRILLSAGPRACQKALFNALGHELEQAGHRILQRPIYLLVPSHSLRNQLLARLVRTRGSVAGVSALTLRGLASEILEQAGESPPGGSEVLPILIRRAARQEQSLQQSLDHLNDGYASLIDTVTDLLEAGFEAPHLDAVEEVLVTEGQMVASAAEVHRAASLARVAARVQEQMEQMGLGHVTSLLKRSTELLRTRSEDPFPTSGFHIYGFADATGVATDLIEAVLLNFGGSVYLDRPHDVLDPKRIDPSWEFSRRFSERLMALGTVEEAGASSVAPAQPVLIEALGTEAEVREIGWRIRQLLDSGSRPEDIALVARQMEPYVSSIRRHFGRLAIPFSASGVKGPLLPRGRRIRALTEVLARRQRVRLDRWLEVRKPDSDAVPVYDLRLALFGLGASRLEELASRPLDTVGQAKTYPLPVRLGFSSSDDPAVEVTLHRRQVPVEQLERIRDDAVGLCDLFTSWTRCRQLSGHLEHFDRLLSQLSWTDDGDPMADVGRVRDNLSTELPATLHLNLDEFSLLVTGALASTGLDAVGGRGGGVQILDVIESRARTFEHLFLLGMNKGIFPRTVREDPALPDALRQVIGREGHGVLPDLPRKRTGYVEESFLFAQLLNASPHATLSWQITDDDNKEVPASPLVERLLWAIPPLEARSPLAPDPPAGHDPAPRTAYESAVQAALYGSPANLEGALAIAIPDRQPRAAKALARSRLSIAAELDRPAGSRSRLGPYFGFIGAVTDSKEARLAQRLYITTLERLAVCPWRTFLERILRLETLPDPVEILPGLDPILVGQLVHRVLERLVRRQIPKNPGSLDEARTAPPATVSWPQPSSLHRLVGKEAILIARGQGIGWDGFARVLAEVAMPYLDRARQQIEISGVDFKPVAAEMECALGDDRAGSDRKLYFKVDRIDTTAGRLLLTDYKTSRSAISTAKTQKTRDRHLLAEIRKGRLLQAAAYAMAAGGAGDRGRYLFVHPDFQGPEETRGPGIDATDKEAQQAFDRAVETLLASWHQGVFFPRLVEPGVDKEPRACERCDVAEACLRGDSGARGRLRDWSAGRQSDDPTERAFLDAWHLASGREREE